MYVIVKRVPISSQKKEKKERGNNKKERENKRTGLLRTN